MNGRNIFDLENAEKMHAEGKNMESCHRIKSHCTQPIKQIYLEQTTLSIAKVNCLKKVLSTVERVKLDNCKINGNFYEKFLKFCPNLKALCIRTTRYYNPNGDHIVMGINNDWLCEKYPTLERLEIIHIFSSKINQLKTFFVENPNIRSFAINLIFLAANLDLFETDDIKLDVLAIRFDGKVDDLTRLIDKLNSFHVFKRLHTNGCTEQMAKVPPINALGKMYV